MHNILVIICHFWLQAYLQQEHTRAWRPENLQHSSGSVFFARYSGCFHTPSWLSKVQNRWYSLNRFVIFPNVAAEDPASEHMCVWHDKRRMLYTCRRKKRETTNKINRSTNNSLHMSLTCVQSYSTNLDVYGQRLCHKQISAYLVVL